MADLHILEVVWGDKRGYVFAPRWQITGFDDEGKPVGPWDEGPAFRWPEDRAAIFARIQKSAEEGYEVYFCPVVFPHPRRKAWDKYTGEYIGPAKVDLLWADLDEANPEHVVPRPSIAWKTSDSKAAALWFLDEPYDALKVLDVNKAVTYANQADKSGWDMTQVLRVPGTENHKYDPPQMGRLLWAEDKRYSLESVASMVVKEAPQTTAKVDVEVAVVPDSDEARLEALRKRAEKYKLRASTKELLLVHPSAVKKGERSEKLWELEKRLIEDGLSVAEALGLVKLSAWNKFRGRRDEDAQLLRDLLKAEKEYRASRREAVEPLPVKRVGVQPQDHEDAGVEYVEGDRAKEEDDAVRWLTTYEEFIEARLQPPQWIVEWIWQEGYGMIAGEPKTFKSVTATDLALSVASGRHFLGKFRVVQTGPVIYLQRENSESTIQDRILKIARQKGLLRDVDGHSYLPPNIEIYFGNNYPIDLTDERWRKRIEATIKQIKPKLLILDPLYMMIGNADENSSSEMNNILTWLTSLRDNYGCYTIIVHHYKKGSEGRGGQRIRGTSAFHGWVETGLYLSLTGEPGVVRMDREFRSMQSPGSIKIKYQLGSAGEWEYRPLVLEDPGSGGAGVVVAYKKEELLSFLAGHGESTRDEIKAALNAELPKINQWLRELEWEGRIVKRRTSTGMRYKLSDQEEKRRARTDTDEDE